MSRRNREPAGSLLTPLAGRGFRWLAAGRFLVYLSNAIAPIALAFVVLDLTGSVAALGAVVAARSAGNVVALFVGGMIADRFSPTVVMRWGPPAAGAVQGVTALLVLVDTAGILTLLALAGLNGLVAALPMPASLAMTPQTVPAGVLREANSLLRLAVNTAMIGGAALGGLLVAGIGAGWALAADAAAFTLAGACFSMMRLTSPARLPSQATILSDLRAGWKEFMGHSWLWPGVLFAMVWQAVWAGSANVLGPAIADATFGARAWGVVVGSLSAGLVLGSLLALRWRPRRALMASILLVSLTAGFPLAIAMAPNVYFLIFAAAVAGVALEQFIIAWDVSIQQNIPANLLARVYSYDMLCSLLAVPVGQVIVGHLGETLGPEPVLIACALAIALGCVVLLSRQGVRRLEVSTMQYSSTSPA